MLDILLEYVSNICVGPVQVNQVASAISQTGRLMQVIEPCGIYGFILRSYEKTWDVLNVDEFWLL